MRGTQRRDWLMFYESGYCREYIKQEQELSGIMTREKGPLSLALYHRKSVSFMQSNTMCMQYNNNCTTLSVKLLASFHST